MLLLVNLESVMDVFGINNTNPVRDIFLIKIWRKRFAIWKYSEITAFSQFNKTKRNRLYLLLVRRLMDNGARSVFVFGRKVIGGECNHGPLGGARPGFWFFQKDYREQRLIMTYLLKRLM